jgi:PAS domain S-box-containing protein
MKAEEALRLTQFAVDRSVDAITWIASDARFVYVNDAACRLMGYSREELLASTVWERNPDFSPEQWQQHWQELKQHGSLIFESHVCNKEGSLVPIEISSNYVEIDGQGYLCAFSRDITARKQTEEALSESEAKFRSIVENANDIIYVIKPDGVISYVCPKLTDVTGYAVSELEGKVFTPYMHPDDLSLCFEALQRVIETGQRQCGIEYRVKHKQGGWKWLIANVSALNDTNGNVLLVGVARDITERKQTEQALRFAQFALDRASDYIFWSNSQGRLLYANDAACQALSYSKEQFLSMALHDIDPNFPKEVWTQHWQKLKQQGSLNFETYNRTKDGRLIPVEVTANYLEFEGQEYNFSFARDITARKQSEEALRASEAELQAILDNSPALIYIKDMQGRYIRSNRPLETLIELTREEIKGKSDYELLPKEIADAFRENDQKVLNAGTALCLEEMLPHDDGLHTYLAVKFPLFNAEGVAYAVCGISTDISDRKLAEIAIRESANQLRTITDNIPALVAYVDRQERYRFVNKQYTELMKIPAAEIIGKRVRDIFDSPVYERRQKYVEAALAGEKVCFEDAYPYNGEEQHWEITLIPHQSESAVTSDPQESQMSGYFVFAQDITQRKRSEAALRRSEIKFRNLFENSQVGIFRTRISDGLILDANQRYIELTGYSCASKVIGQKFSTQFYVNLDDRQLLLTQLHQYGEVNNFEMQFRQRDGSVRWGLYSIRLNVEEGCLEGVLTDISDLKEAEAALRHSEVKFRNIFENSLVGIFRTRISDGLILDVNQRGVEMIGYDCVSEVIGKKYSRDLYANPDDRQRILRQVRQHGTVKNLEIQFRRRDGSVRWGLFGVRLDAEEGCFEGVLTDITDRKQLEAQLLYSQRFLDSIVENIPLALFAKDVNNDFRNVLWNKTCEEMFGIPREQALGRNVYDFQPTEQADFFHAKDLESLETGKLIEIAEEPFDTKHQGTILLRTLKLPLFDNQGKATHLLCISEDITERKQREEALQLIFEGTASKTGDEFFRSCVRYLAEVLSVRYTFLAEWANEAKTRVRTLAVWQGEDWGENFEYDLANHPCENVLAGKTCYYPKAVRSLFPDDEALVELAAESYLGTPLIDPCGRVLGHLAVLDTKPMADDLIRELILRIFAARAGAELKRKQAEEALQHRARADSLLSSISRQFLDQDIDCAINFALQAIGQFLGVSTSNVFKYDDSKTKAIITHQWCSEHIQTSMDEVPESSSETHPWFHCQILSGQTVQVHDIESLPPDAVAEKVTFETLSIQSVLDVPMIHSGNVVGFIGVDVVGFQKVWTQEDINLLKLVGELIAMSQARQAAEEALRVAKEAAEAANRAKSAFLANMSHELRTPLNAILGFSQLMAHDSSLNQQQQDYLGTISRSGEHLLALINDVLEMSKIEAGRTTLYQQSFNLYRLLDYLEEMLQLKAKSKNLQLTFERSPDVPQYVKTDESKLRQVLLNLLGNAIKFTQAGSVTLRVRVGEDTGTRGHGDTENSLESISNLTASPPLPHSLVFEVEDTGPGIAPEELEILFEAFVQTETGRNSQQGTGLGLAISRQFVKMMGGDITVNSRLCEGTVFTFDIQVGVAEVTEEQTQQPSRRVIGLAPNQPKYRILVVEDVRENRQLLVKVLEILNVEVREAVNGQEAIALSERWHPHLIWMDMRMPVMDGYEATRQIKARPNGQDTVIIALTASAFEEERSIALSAGCDDFVRKPIQEAVIFDKMAEYLGISYVYEQAIQSSSQRQSTSQLALTPDALAVMPAEWVKQLSEAATQVDSELVVQLIAQIPEEAVELANGLTNLVNNYRFDRIIALTQLATG